MGLNWPCPHHTAILEAKGFECEGRMREHASIRGVRVDSLLHGLLADGWRAGRSTAQA